MDGPYFITDSEDGLGKCFVLTSPWTDDFIDIITEEKIVAVRITEKAAGKGGDISFIEKLKDIGLLSMEIFAWSVRDLTPLTFFPGLEVLGIQCDFVKAPDFSNFSQLRILKLIWRPKATTVFYCSSLEEINIVNFPDEDLGKLSGMTELKRLQLTSRKLLSLSGIEFLEKLQVFDGAYCTKLRGLAGLEKCKNIQVVELQACRKICDVSELGELNNLKDVFLIDCGKIGSLQSLDNCGNLENLFFPGDTNILDGELTALFEMPKLKKLTFANRRHYSHKREQFNVRDSDPTSFS
ncbi:hypothetical protein [Thalassospira marina]|uniref:hypothetical protein n=1 Tax=Thalassospira marina TaxID=2048283 RepID=UPI001054A934|nr:hypothetical protein [Thalassospira marina]